MQKLLASEMPIIHFLNARHPNSPLANAHRLFVTTDSQTSSPTLSPSPLGNLSGIVSIVDSASVNLLLSLIADLRLSSFHLRPASTHLRH